MKRKEEQLELIDKPKQRGGARPGSGRKAQRGETTVMRVPQQYKAAIESLIAHLDKTKGITGGMSWQSSEPMFSRSLEQKRQFLTFVTSAEPEDFEIVTKPKKALPR